MTVRVGPAKTPTRCPLCREELGELALGRCHSCATTFHQECLEELGGCPTNGCAQRGMVPHDVERPSACPACGELVRRESYDCVCGGRYHLECVFEGCIRPACRFFEIPLGGRKRPWNWRPTAQRICLAVALGAVIYLLYLLLLESSSESTKTFIGSGFTIVLFSYLALTCRPQED